MNNRYIYKAKRKDNNEWVYGGIYYQKADEVKEEAVYIIGGSLNDVGAAYEVIPETVGQCTGLEAKNGKLIFKNDIVKADGYIFFVEFGKCGGVANDENYGYMGYYLDGFDSMTKKVLRLGLRNDICYFTDIEVIGNIHDNSEFVEVER